MHGTPTGIYATGEEVVCTCVEVETTEVSATDLLVATARHAERQGDHPLNESQAAARSPTQSPCCCVYQIAHLMPRR